MTAKRARRTESDDTVTVQKRRLIDLLNEGVASLQSGRVVSQDDYERQMGAILEGRAEKVTKI
jgi:hypothetical protein